MAADKAAHHINSAEAEDFIERADDVSRLIAGLQEGTISPEYIDRHYSDKFGVAGKGKEDGAGPSGSKATTPAALPAPPSKESIAAEEEAAAKEAERRARLMDKAMVLKASYERKLKARAKFEEYSKAGAGAHNTGTDYTKWDLWCPEDEEDEMISQITPNNPAFRSMEKDIDERHNRCMAHAWGCMGCVPQRAATAHPSVHPRVYHVVSWRPPAASGRPVASRKCAGLLAWLVSACVRVLRPATHAPLPSSQHARACSLNAPHLLPLLLQDD
jgi:hypothetical protein